MELSIIIPVCNRYEMITHLLESLSSLNYEIIFILNGICDAKLISALNTYSKKHKHIKILKLTVIMNYAQINNIAVRECIGRYILLLNSDVIISPETIDNLLNEIKKDGKIGAIQALLLYPQNLTIQSAGHIFCEYNNYHAAKGKIYTNTDSVNIKRQALTTACCCLKKELYLALNGMDEFYYNAFEGMELTLRITKEGYLCYCKSDAIAFHYQGISRGEMLLQEDPDIGKFWSAHGKYVKNDLYDEIKKQIDKFSSLRFECIINCSNLRNVNTFSEKGIGYKIDSLVIQDRLYDKIIISNNIPSFYLKKCRPYIWLTTHFSQVINNVKTFEAYSRVNDIIVDLSGNIVPVKSLLK